MEIYNRQYFSYGSFLKIYVYVIVRLRDGIYMDNWVNIQSVTTININTEFDFLNRNLSFKELNTSIRTGQVMSFGKNVDSKRLYLLIYNFND